MLNALLLAIAIGLSANVAPAAPASGAFAGLIDVGGWPQDRLAALVAGARHMTNTASGHEIHKEQPALVIGAIVDVIDAVRAGKTITQ